MRLNAHLGLSDHDIVTAMGSVKPTTQKQKPRKVHLFSKADWTKLKSLMKDFQVSFLSSHKGKSVEDLWNNFTSTLSKYIDECIPTKILKGKSTLPWITQDIKRLIRKRDKLYSSYKKTQDYDKRKSFLTLRQQEKRKIKASYLVYLEGLLGLRDEESKCDSKKLFSFLGNPRKTNAASHLFLMKVI